MPPSSAPLKGGPSGVAGSSCDGGTWKLLRGADPAELGEIDLARQQTPGEQTGGSTSRWEKGNVVLPEGHREAAVMVG